VGTDAPVKNHRDPQSGVTDAIPSRPTGAAIALDVLRTAALIERVYNKLVAGHGITMQQYNVLRILRGAAPEGLPTLVIRDRMIHEATGITRLLDKLEQAGLARRDRSESDRRMVVCHITGAGCRMVESLESEIDDADEAAVASLSVERRRELVVLLDAVRSGKARQR
jgi:DNA-binding MarR family transcriptional regulator